MALDLRDMYGQAFFVQSGEELGDGQRRLTNGARRIPSGYLTKPRLDGAATTAA